MKKTIRFIAMAVLCFFLAAPAIAQFTALKVGDKMPGMSINNILTPAKAANKISDFKGKLLILNFWSTDCRASKDLLTTMAELEQNHSGKLKVISVGKGDPEDMKKIVLERGLSNRTFISEDSLLNTLFPHYLYPQLVWIGQDQKILGITTAADANTTTINKILGAEAYTFSSPKSDRMDYNSEKPLFSLVNSVNSNSLYHSVLSSYADGLPGGMGIQKDSNTVRIYAINQGRLNLYFLALKLPRYTWPMNRIAYQNVNIEKFRVGLRPEERRGKQYCYELSLPKFFDDRIYSYMLEDLERLFGTGARLEKRMSPCYILSPVPGKLKLQTSGAKAGNNFKKAGPEKKFMVNSTLYVLTEYLESISGGLPVINETNFSGRADIKLNANSPDILSLNTALAQYGLKIGKGERAIDILVLYSTDHENPKRSQPLKQN